MGPSLRLGRWLGIRVYIHWTLFLVPGLILGYSAFSGGAGWGLLLAALLMVGYACVLLHEFGHALVARLFHISTRDITLYPIGGVARLSRMSERPAEEFWIAIAGPFVNLAIALIAGAAWLATSISGGAAVQEDWLLQGRPLQIFLNWLLSANLVLFVFNLMPAFPMDGGRILRALLTALFGLSRATEIAAGFGLVMSAIFIIVGMLSIVGMVPLSPMLVLVGLFVVYAGRQELGIVRRRHKQAQPLQVLPADATAVDEIPVPAEFSGFTWDQKTQLWIEWRNGQRVSQIYVDPN